MTPVTPVTARTGTTLGMISALLAVACFSVNDASIKFLSGDYALHQIVLIRSVLVLAILLVMIVPFQGGYGGLRTRRLHLHLLRAAFVVIANMTFFVGLSVLPLADATAVFFFNPLLITVLSVVVLGERVGALRWMAVLVGMAGVLIMLRPGGGFQPAMLLPLAAGASYAALSIMTRKIGGTENAASMVFYTQLTFVAVCAVIGLAAGDGAWSGRGGTMFEFLLRGWVWPAPGDYPVLLLIGVAAAFAAFFISQAYRIAEASAIAPFEYATMPAVIILGVLIFDEWPDAVSWVGMFLIVGAGLFVFWRENVHGRRAAPARLSARRPVGPAGVEGTGHVPD